LLNKFESCGLLFQVYLRRNKKSKTFVIKITALLGGDFVYDVLRALAQKMLLG
jgi:hypothetical protein